MWLAVQMASTKYNRSERSDDPSRHRQNGNRAHIAQNNTGRGSGTEVLYKFLQLEDSNSSSHENLGAAAAAATAAANYSVPGASISSSDVSMEIEHVESL